MAFTLGAVDVVDSGITEYLEKTSFGFIAYSLSPVTDAISRIWRSSRASQEYKSATLLVKLGQVFALGHVQWYARVGERPQSRRTLLPASSMS